MPEGFPDPLDEPLDGPGGGYNPFTPPTGGGGGFGGALVPPTSYSPLLELLRRKRLYGGRAQSMQGYPGSYSPLDSGGMTAYSASPFDSGGMTAYSTTPGPSVEPSPGGEASSPNGIGGWMGGTGRPPSSNGMGGLMGGTVQPSSSNGIGGLMGGTGEPRIFGDQLQLHKLFSDLIGGANKAGAFNPNGNPQIMNMIRKLFEGQGATRERSARLGLQAQGSDPSLYGYASLMSQLGAQSDLSRQLGGAQLSEMQRANDFFRQLLAQRYGQLYQPKPKKDGGFDVGGALGGLGSLIGAFVP